MSAQDKVLSMYTDQGNVRLAKQFLKAQGIVPILDQLQRLVLVGSPEKDELADRLAVLEEYISVDVLFEMTKAEPKLLDFPQHTVRLTREQLRECHWWRFVWNTHMKAVPHVEAFRQLFSSQEEAKMFLISRMIAGGEHTSFDVFWKFAELMCPENGKSIVVDQWLFRHGHGQTELTKRMVDLHKRWSDILPHLPRKLHADEVIAIERARETYGYAISLLHADVCDQKEFLIKELLVLDRQGHIWGTFWLHEATDQDFDQLPTTIADMLCARMDAESRKRLNRPASMYERRHLLIQQIRANSCLSLTLVLREARLCGPLDEKDVSKLIYNCTCAKSISHTREAAALANRSLTAEEVDQFVYDALYDFVADHASGEGNVAKQIVKIESVCAEGCSPEMRAQVDLVLAFYRSQTAPSSSLLPGL